MPCSTQGAITRLSIASQQLPFKLIDDQTTRHLVDDNEDGIITGLMDPLETRVSLGIVDIVLNVRLHPTPLELTALFPYLGMTLSAGTATLDESVASFSMVIDRSAKVHTYATCYVNTWTLGGQTSVTRPIYLDLQIFGTTFSEGVSFGSPTALVTDAPYPFTAGVLTLQSSTRVFDRFALTTRHNLQKQFENSLTANCIDMTHRRTTLATSVGYVAANTDLHTTPQSAATGAAATLAFTRGGQSDTITFTNVKSIARPASIPGQVALRLPLFYRVYRTVAAKAFSIAHDDSI